MFPKALPVTSSDVIGYALPVVTSIIIICDVKLIIFIAYGATINKNSWSAIFKSLILQR